MIMLGAYLKVSDTVDIESVLEAFKKFSDLERKIRSIKQRSFTKGMDATCSKATN